ncbi:MAG: anti-sigma factor [Betaproteobacteria bacterium]|nr:MAG: anti-sigma factor [Betaproteobacteria bacterium]
MTEAVITESELQAYADGRLDAERGAAVEAWLAARPEEAERITEYRRITEELRAAYDPVLDEPVPERLAQALGARARWPRYAAVAAWFALGAAIGALAGWQLHATRPAAPLSADIGLVMARRAAIAHATYSPEVRHPVEVGADQEDHLVAWLSKRLGTPLRAPKLETAGYSLVGGRLLPGENGPVAHFMYQSNQGTRVTLYVRTEGVDNRETAFRYAKEGNVRVFYWVDRKLGYALSSAETSKDELFKLANAVYQQLNP